MEKFIIGLFSEQLSTFIHGFRREQLNANLLNGKGEISDVQIKVQPVNAILRRFTSLIELSSVYVSKLNFNVTSFRQIKKAPIVITIDEVHIMVVEPLSKEPYESKQTWPELAQAIVKSTLAQGPYGIIERISDNLTIDIHRVYLTFQPMGKFKTQKIGPWTPPALSFVFNHLRFVTVDEYGEEGKPEDVWYHNTRRYRQEQKQQQEAHARHNNSHSHNNGDSNGNGSGNNSVPQSTNRDRDKDGMERALRPRTFMIYKKASLELSIAIGYRASTTTSPKEMFFSSKVIVANLPLQSHICIHRRLKDNNILAVQMDCNLVNLELELGEEVMKMMIHFLTGLIFLFNREDQNVDPFEGEDHMMNGKNGNAYGGGQGDDASMEYSKNTLELPPEVAPDEDDVDGDADADEEEEEENDIGNGTNNANPLHSKEEEWPVVILPAGLTVVEKLSVSMSIHHMGIRIRYLSNVTKDLENGDEDAYLQLTLKGLMAELIWPKGSGIRSDSSLGGHLQMSLGYIHVHEIFGKFTQLILHGGRHFGTGAETGAEGGIQGKQGEMKDMTQISEQLFPIFESSRIRSQYVDLRSTFPLQVFGLKSTIDVLGKEKLITSSSQFSILTEMGINDVVLDILPETAIRISKFLEGGGSLVNPQWFSGDWSAETGISNMMEKYITITADNINTKAKQRQPFELSPELFNITAKLSGVEVNLPPLITNNNMRSGTLTMSLSECMFVVSPSLPRLFLSEEVPTRDTNHSSFPAGFPNNIDASKDNPYEGNVQLIPFVRMQMTANDISLIFKPSLSYYDAAESNRLMNVGKVDMLGSYEISEEVIKGANAHLFMSTLIHDANLNVDFDVLSNILVTMISHKDALPFGPNMDLDDLHLQKLSDFIDPFNFIGRVSLTEFNLRVFRQHLCLGEQRSGPSIPVACLLRYQCEDLEIGGTICKPDSIQNFTPFSVKGSLGKMKLLTNRFSSSIELTEGLKSIDEFDGSIEDSIILFGSEMLDCDCLPSILFHMERWRDPGDFDIGFILKSGEIGISEHLDVVLGLIIEGVLHPDWPQFPTPSFSSLPLRADKKNELGLDDNVDPRLKFLSTILCVDPELINVVNIKLQGEDISMFVPYQNKKIALVGENICLFSGYLGQNDMSTLHQNKWEIAYHDNAPGFHHILSSTQKIVLYRNSGGEPVDEIIGSFGVDTYLHPSNLRSALNDCSLSVEEMIICEELYKTAEQYYQNFSDLYEDTMLSMATFSGRRLNSPQTIAPQLADTDSPLLLVYETSKREFEKTRTLLKDMKDRVLLNEEASRALSKKATEEMFRLRGNLLQSEIDRTAAYSLMCHQMSGFIRIGGTTFSGQRSVNFTNFWEHYAVLKGSNLIIFKDTTHTKPLHLISLKGATLHSISGSGAKRIFSRAFAIVELGGNKTFYVAPTYNDFEKWVKALEYATLGKQRLSSSEDHDLDTYLNTDHLPLNDSSHHAESVNVSSNLDVIAPINYEDFGGTMVSFDDDLAASDCGDLSQQFQATDSQDIADNMQPSVSEDGLDDNMSFLSYSDDQGKRGAKFRDRMAKMKASVKNNVKHMNENVKIMKTENRVARRQRLGSSNGGKTLANAAFKLKQVKANNDEPQTKEVIKVEEHQDLHLIPGKWSCNVKITVSKDKKAREVSPTPVQIGGEEDTELLFDITLACQQNNEISTSNHRKVSKSFSQLLKLHSTISATLVAVLQNPQAASLGILESDGNEEIFSQVINSGKALKGLLHLSRSKDPNCFDYVGNVITAFINALFSDPIPTTVFNIVLAFFGMTDMSTSDSSFQVNNNLPTNVLTNEKSLVPPTSTDILSLLHNCELTVARSERHLVRAHTLSRIKSPVETFRKNHDVPRSSNYLKDNIMQQAITSVMLERDEAHTALVSSRVFHAHQVDLQRRKIELLESKLRFIEESSNLNSAPGAAFFLGQETIPDINSVTKIEKEMIQNVDVELLELCRQLSSAISSRVAAELEIVRIKESRRVEQAAEAANRAQLDDEVQKYKIKAENETLRREAAEIELQKWKDSYAALLQSESSRD